MRKCGWGALALLLGCYCASGARAQDAQAKERTKQADLEKQVEALSQQVAQLSKEVVALEAERKPQQATPSLPARPAAPEAERTAQATQRTSESSRREAGVTTLAADAPASLSPNPAPAQAAGTPSFLRGTTLNLLFDGYYEYNFNAPVGRVNLLRAYDVSSNSFSLNQADVVLERAPDLTEGRRFGARLDLQYGQATETLQGNAANELRPQVYRPVFQAYGTYVAPVGSGLTIDFGKWASALGIENNYTKDQMNYSRSFLFNFLPFYHMGFRAGYDLTPKVNVAYWLVNGAQQTEAFSGFKSQAFLFTLKPAKTLTWNVNYFFGEQHPDVVPVLNPGFPTEPTQPGLPTTPVVPAPTGREHIFDTYATWNATSKLTLAGEGDYVVDRFFSDSAPRHVSAGAAYVRYQLTPKLDIAGRAEYFSDRGGLFSGTTQALKETTLTTEYQLGNGFQMFWEWRRDFSNQPFFLTAAPGVVKKEQNTAALGLVWWWGGKQGTW